MEKVININFQGRVIPIEESAYDSLKEYTDGLRRHFAGEESSDEIISDIENRIAELLTNRLKQGVNCINLSHLNTVLDSIGRPEDMETTEGEESGSGTAPGANAGPSAQGSQRTHQRSERFYRNENDKVIAGVCSGIADRMNVDPVIVRIFFVVLSGALFWIYILLWLIVPSQDTEAHITRRLFRNPDDKVIAGVCGGLGRYFRLDSWKIRLIFLLPMILGGAFRSLRWMTWNGHWGWGPGFFAGSFGSTLFVLYIILWIAVPYATTLTDKMEMSGEKIDLNSIKAATRARGGVPMPPPRRGSGIGRVIGFIFKAFFLFIGGIVAIALFAALAGLVFAGAALEPYADFVIDGTEQYTLVWLAVALILGVPLLSLVVSLVRKLMGVRSRRYYLGYIFGLLWVVGVVLGVAAIGNVVRNFAVRSVVEEPVPFAQPSTNSLYVQVLDDNSPHYRPNHRYWRADWDENDPPFHLVAPDSLWMNTVKVDVVQSPDSLFHVYKARTSRAATVRQAKELASHVAFEVRQMDSVISLPGGFTISNRDNFRNQQVLVTVEVPLGKSVRFSDNIDKYDWFDIETDNHHVRYRNRTHRFHDYRGSREYRMTISGLRSTRDDTMHTRDWSDDEEDDDDE